MPSQRFKDILEAGYSDHEKWHKQNGKRTPKPSKQKTKRNGTATRPRKDDKQGRDAGDRTKEYFDRSSMIQVHGRIGSYKASVGFNSYGG